MTAHSFVRHAGSAPGGVLVAHDQPLHTRNIGRVAHYPGEGRSNQCLGQIWALLLRLVFPITDSRLSAAANRSPPTLINL